MSGYTFLFFGLGLMVGAFAGIVTAALVAAPGNNIDTQRLDHLSLFNLQLSNINGRWAVLQNVNGMLTMVGDSHGSAREAIDAAMEVRRG